MWTVIFITCNNSTVQKIRQLFKTREIMVRVRRVNENGESGCYEVMVPYAEVSAAHDIIIEEEFN